MRRVGAGMWLGLAVVAIAVLWERVAYPGLTDFAKPYRAVGLFWEMHVGGAAIDAYLAMATPFAVWALWSARHALAMVDGGRPGTARGVRLPDDLLARRLPRRRRSLLFLGVAAKGRTSPLRWRRRAGRVLVAILLLEVVAVIATGSFLTERMARSERDLRSRIAHWTKGVGLLHDPSDVALGIGLGRLPSHFTRFVAGYEFSGAVRRAGAEGAPQGLAGAARRAAAGSRACIL